MCVLCVFSVSVEGMFDELLSESVLWRSFDDLSTGILFLDKVADQSIYAGCKLGYFGWCCVAYPVGRDES